MYCRNCGNQLNDGSAFCNKCGYATDTRNRDSKKKRIIICSSILLLVVLCITTVLIWPVYNYEYRIISEVSELNEYVVTYSYDEAGKCVAYDETDHYKSNGETVEDKVHCEYKYDNNDRITTISHTYSSEPECSEVCELDSDGNLIKVNGEEDGIFVIKYNKEGHLVYKKDNEGNIIENEYNSDGTISKRTSTYYGNTKTIEYSYTYDENGNPKYGYQNQDGERVKYIEFTYSEIPILRDSIISKIKYRITH